MGFYTLYKQNNTGKIQQWQVSVEVDPETSVRNIVKCEYGQVDGKLQSTEDLIKGKNIGKANETTDEEQAFLKAQQLFDKKVKQGYVPDLEQAQTVKNNLAAIEPMLAHPIEKKLKYAKFPAFAQPKLDGFRCIAMIKDGEVQLFSRTQKEITTLPHIKEVLGLIFPKGEIILDGELYNHELKHDFERLAGIIKRDQPHKDAGLIHYHIYDCPAFPDLGWEDRMSNFLKAYAANPVEGNDCVHIVNTIIVESMEDVEFACKTFIQSGYEGAMYRNSEMPYEFKRSAGLLKVKVFEDAEFVVVDSIEGNGKLRGTAGAIVVQDPNNPEVQFKAKLKRLEDGNGKTVESKEDFQARCTDWLVNIDNYKGKLLTVKFQGRTAKGVPRFPIGLRLREDI